MKLRRLGRAPTQEISSIGVEGHSHGPYDPQNVPDQILADKLADHDDPRELYVRRDLGYRAESSSASDYGHSINREHNRLNNNAGVVRHYDSATDHELGDGTSLTVSPHGGTEESPTSYEHFWNMGSPTYNAYGAVLSPQEHHEQMRKLGLTKVPQQMSRNKPMIVSYERNPRRYSLKKKYAAATVARVMGQGQYANDMPTRVAGSRLATVLREIKHGVGRNNERLDKLTDHALGGSHRPELYTAIRDELFRSKDPRAAQLARQYNWHKVGEGLERDQHLRNFVMNASKGTSHEGHGQMFRRFYNGVVHQQNGPDENRRQLFYKAMRKHLQNQTGKDHSYEQIEDSLRRIGETEANHEQVQRGGAKGGSKFEVPDYQTPAYTGVPKEGKSPPKKQVTPIEKRAPGQFQRPRFRFKL